MRRLIVFPVSLLLTACATQIRVDYLSEPAGATIYESGRPVARAPQSLFYEPSAEFRNGGCMRTQPMTARWISGAEQSIGSIQLCAVSGRAQNFMFVRPNVPGAETDANYALQLQRNAIMAQQARAAQRAADAADTAATLQMMRALQPAPPPAPVICNTQPGLSRGSYQTVCR